MVSRRTFLGWSTVAGYGGLTLLRPPHAHAGPKKKVFPAAATGSGAAFDATVAVVSGGGVYSDLYDDLY